MKIQVDPFKLIAQLKAWNEDIDLTGLKAYLFDLVAGDSAPVLSETSLSHGVIPAVPVSRSAPQQFAEEGSDAPEVQEETESEGTRVSEQVGQRGQATPVDTRKVLESLTQPKPDPRLKRSTAASTGVPTPKEAESLSTEELVERLYGFQKKDPRPKRRGQASAEGDLELG